MIGTRNDGLRHDVPASTVAGIVRDIAHQVSSAGTAHCSRPSNG